MSAIWAGWFLVFAALLGVFSATLGGRLPRKGDWVSLAGTLAAAAAATLAWSERMSVGVSRAGDFSWVVPGTGTGGIGLGFGGGALGPAMSLFSALLGALLVGSGVFSGEPREERLHGSVPIAAAGAGFAWMGSGLWMVFVGVLTTILAGATALSSRWERNAEAELVARYLRERVWGLFAALLGAYALSSSGESLLWERLPWQLASGSGRMFGLALVCIGLGAQFQPFPLIGWLLMPSEAAAPARLSVAMVFPALAAMSGLSWLESTLRADGLLAGLAGVALVCAMFSFLTGLVQAEWRRALGLWMSGVFTLALAALGGGGTWPGIATLIGAAAGAVGVHASIGARKGSPPRRPGAGGKRKNQAVLIFCLATSSGMAGFCGSSGMVQWLANGSAHPTLFVAIAIALFLSAMLVWNVGWSILGSDDVVGAEPGTIVGPLLSQFLALGVFWTGALSGGLLHGWPDRLFEVPVRAIVEAVFLEAKVTEGAHLTGVWASFAVFGGGIALSYWTGVAGRGYWGRLRKAAPWLVGSLESGIWLEKLGRSGLRAIQGMGRLSIWAVDLVFWGRALPSFGRSAMHGAGRAVSAFERVLTTRVEGGVRAIAIVPAKALQLLQTGDIRWYIFQAMGLGMALAAYCLIHSGE